MWIVSATVTSIDWDCDEPGDIEALPTRLTLEIPYLVDGGSPGEQEIDDAISDAITNQTGFCHKGYAATYTLAEQCSANDEGSC
jgi:hypothetical protein